MSKFLQDIFDFPIIEDDHKKTFKNLFYKLRIYFLDVLKMSDHITRIATVVSVGESSITCSLDGENVTAVPTYKENNALNALVKPSFAEDDKIAIVFSDGVYYIITPFVDEEE
jgi:hypothetical protein